MDENQIDDLPDDNDWLDNPYYFKSLYVVYRKLIQFIGNWPEERIHGKYFLNFTDQHDIIRRLIAWNFIAIPSEDELPEYEEHLFFGDWEVEYLITDQARNFVKLELNNISDLSTAILILVRSDFDPRVRQGLVHTVSGSIGFYELVILLNKPEQTILKALKRLSLQKFINLNLIFSPSGKVDHLTSSISITDQGIMSIEKGDKTMIFNNIYINKSTVGVVAFESTLSNIDVTIGNLKDSGNIDIAKAISSISENVVDSNINDKQKKEVLERIELLAEEAKKKPEIRRITIVTEIVTFIEKTLSVTSKLASVWNSCGPILIKYFGL